MHAVHPPAIKPGSRLAVTCGGALNLNPHLHSIVPDGLFVADSSRADGSGESLRSETLPSPATADIEELTATIARRLMERGRRLGEKQQRLPRSRSGRSVRGLLLLPKPSYGIARDSFPARDGAGVPAGQSALRLHRRLLPPCRRRSQPRTARPWSDCSATVCALPSPKIDSPEAMMAR